MTDTSKSFTLAPSHNAYLFHYALGILTLPIFGLGLLLFWMAYSSRNAAIWLVNEQSVIQKEKKKAAECRIDFGDVQHIEVKQTFACRLLKTGSVLISTKDQTITLYAQKNPHEIAAILSIGVEREKSRPAKTEKQSRVSEPAGEIDKINYLTGLWQQGLIDEESYKKELKHFQ